MSEHEETIGRTEEAGKTAPAHTSPWAQGVLLGGMLAVIVTALFTDASKLSGAWGSFAASLMGDGLEPKASSSTKDRVLLWNDNVMGAIGKLEERLDLESPLCQWVQPNMQGWLASMGEGGEEVMIGEDGWLFYRPSFNYLTARPLSRKQSIQTQKGYDAAFLAVRNFSNLLRNRGIELVLVPVPPKLAIHPEKFVGDREEGVIETNDYRKWLSRVQREEIRVFDTAEALSSFLGQSNVPAYLQGDTHWRPESMEWCAHKLAEYLHTENLINGPPSPDPDLIEPITIAGRGDLWRMLRLKEDNTLVKAEEVPLNQVRTSGGMRWQPSRKAEVLLMGDSFCNIFSLGEMEWGQGAGFAEHLGRNLRRPVDAILRNSDGAHATRQILAQELARGTDRLDGKTVVIWEFAARELTEGRWLEYNYGLGEKLESQFIEVDQENSIELEATIVEISPIPVPGSVPYQDFVAAVHLRDLINLDGGDAGGTEVLAYAKAMETNRWTDLAGLRSGQRVRIRVTSWLDAEQQFGRWNRSEASEDLLLEPINWLDDIKLVAEED